MDECVKVCQLFGVLALVFWVLGSGLLLYEGFRIRVDPKYRCGINPELVVIGWFLSAVFGIFSWLLR